MTSGSVRGARSRVRAKRSLGQNFLVDPNLQRKIVAALEATANDEVIEIGPGRGALTAHLAGSVRRLVLVELDDDLARASAEEYAGRRDVEVVHRDVLEIDRAELLDDPGAALVIGNIPYNITTPIVFSLLERPRPRRAVLMVQEEVADRLVAPVGSKAYGALTVGVAAVATVEKLFKVRRGAFRPSPNVDSAVVRITPTVPEPLRPDAEQDLRRLVRATFQWRRKQLGKTLRDHPELRTPADVVALALATADVSPEERPESLSAQRFIRLAGALATGSSS